MVKFLHLTKSSHQSFFNKVCAKRFLTNFQSIFSQFLVNFQSNFVDLFSFFEQIFSQFFSQFQANFQSNFVHLFSFLNKLLVNFVVNLQPVFSLIWCTCLILFLKNCAYFAFKLLFLKNPKVYSFNKVFTLVFFNKVTALGF